MTNVAQECWAVVGASGFVGRNVVGNLQERRIKVIEVTAPRLIRDAPVGTAPPAPWSFSDSEVARLAESLEGADIVVNAAGLAQPGSALTRELVGANSALPALVAVAAASRRARRFIHLSSAAVQGRRRELTESSDVAPFSPYSWSKAWGEQGLEHLARSGHPAAGLEIVSVRATSVMGEGRPTTLSLQRFAQSPWAVVADPSAHTPVVSVQSLADLVYEVGTAAAQPPAIVLQPWEGLTTAAVLELASGRRSRRIPQAVARAILRTGYVAGALSGERLVGAVRRAELLWFGQAQAPGWADARGLPHRREVDSALKPASSQI